MNAKKVLSDTNICVHIESTERVVVPSLEGVSILIYPQGKGPLGGCWWFFVWLGGDIPSSPFLI